MLKCVLKIEGLSASFCPGLRALKKHSGMIDVADKGLLFGSVDLDVALKKAYPKDCRWDYLVEYHDRLYCIEVHPANGEHCLTEMKGKVEWLRKWLLEAKKHWEASQDGCKSSSLQFEYERTFLWIATGTVSPKPDNKKLAQLGLKIAKKPRLPY